MNNFYKKVICILLISMHINGFSQISPPGLGEANTAGWTAFGLRQELDTLKKKQLVSYIGFGRKSSPNNYNPYFKPVIFVVNQEFYNHFHYHWQYSFALSYRKQNEYSDRSPYERDYPNFKQEIRVYGRYSYLLKKPKFQLSTTFRQEFRKFYKPDFYNWSETFQIRSRLRTQLKFNLNEEKTHRLIVSYEALFSINKREENQNKWSVFGYQESRFCLYYSWSPKKSPLIFNIGYMNNLLRKTSPKSVQYMALDVILENPFKLRRKRKENIEEFLE